MFFSFCKKRLFRYWNLPRAARGSSWPHTTHTSANTENEKNIKTYSKVKYSEGGWIVFMVKIFLNSNFACGYCLDLNNCTKRWNCIAVKNEQLNESFSNYTHFAYREQQWNNNSRDSSAVSWLKSWRNHIRLKRRLKDVKRYFDYSLDVFQKQSAVNQLRYVTTY